VAIANQLNVARRNNECFRNRIRSIWDVYDGAVSVPPDGSLNRFLNFPLAGTCRHLKDLAMQIRKGRWQCGHNRRNISAGYDTVIDGDQAAVAVERIADGERVANGRHIRIEDAPPQHDRADSQRAAPDDIIHDQSRSLIAHAD